MTRHRGEEKQKSKTEKKKETKQYFIFVFLFYLNQKRFINHRKENALMCIFCFIRGREIKIVDDMTVYIYIYSQRYTHMRTLR